MGHSAELCVGYNPILKIACSHISGWIQISIYHICSPNFFVFVELREVISTTSLHTEVHVYHVNRSQK